MKDNFFKKAGHNKTIRNTKLIYLYTVTGIIICSTLLFGGAFLLSLIRMNSRTEDLVTSNVYSAAEGVDTLFQNYYETLENLIPNTDIQHFLLYDSKDSRYNSTKGLARGNLVLASKMVEGFNFIALYKNPDECIYSGSLITTSGFPVYFENDYKASKDWGRGDFSASYDKHYFNNAVYTLSLYQPVYDMRYVGRVIGTLCMNVQGKALRSLCKEHPVGGSSLKLSIVSDTGEIFYSDNDSDYVDLNIDIPEQNGGFSKNGMYYCFCKISHSNMYVVGSISNKEIISSSIVSLSLILLGFILLLITILFINRWSIKKIEEPMKHLVIQMNTVAEGNLSIRIDENAYGEDFSMVAQGFNQMLERIDVLMDQIRTEESQIAEIRLNQLQSQIKPHFLYNVLDCIHWEALSNSDREVSDMVKALATYYRLSLSNGRDIVSLGEEINCVKNYIILMNIRFKNIVEFYDQSEEKYNEIQIPKVSMQPLVENSIYHGMKHRKGSVQGKLWLVTKAEGSNLIISIKDNGVGMANEDIDKMNLRIQQFDGDYGYGVRNVNHRIKLLYGFEYGLRYESNEIGGITVNISIPLNQ